MTQAIRVVGTVGRAFVTPVRGSGSSLCIPALLFLQWLILGTSFGRAQETKDPLTLLMQLSTELKSVQLEVLECRLEMQAAKASQVEREWKQARFEQQRLEASERQQNRELAQLDQQLAQPGISQETRSELETFRNELLQETLPKLRSERSSTGQNDAELAERLRVERQLLQQLRDRARGMVRNTRPQ
jgi:hypothetical protein